MISNFLDKFIPFILATDFSTILLDKFNIAWENGVEKINNKKLTRDKKAPTQHSANRLVLANRFHTCVLISLMTDFFVVGAVSMVSTFM